MQVATTSAMPIMKQNDDHLAALMRAAQSGDTHAYTQLLKTVTPRLRAVIRQQRRFLQSDQIEDLVQDVLLSVHAVRATYDPERPFMPWLMAIARNRLADGARRYVRRAEHEVAVEKLPVTFSADEANREAAEYGDPQALKRAIQELPPRQREAIEMLKLRQLSLKEASAASGTSIGALKISVHRGIATLRKMLAKG
jgi:RNA polymerase sigma factor (sigma-70 family)